MGSSDFFFDLEKLFFSDLVGFLEKDFFLLVFLFFDIFGFDTLFISISIRLDEKLFLLINGLDLSDS